MFAGSSPLTRGTRIDSGQNDRFNRFIPAYAGNSCSNAPVSATIPVHPRLRGELTSRGLPFMVVIGSSPLTRGTLAFDDASYSAARFIPAYAGNSNHKDASREIKPVHPRLRGELECKPFYGLDFGGSSPLTRGTLTITTEQDETVSVHPRLRGELT